MSRHMSLFLTASIGALMLLIGGCASTGERPDADLQAATSAVQQAVAKDAQKFEPALLNEAQNKVADAKELIKQEKFIQARRLLEQALVDAQLAGARSETAKAKQAVRKINRNIITLRRQINQKKLQP